MFTIYKYPEFAFLSLFLQTIMVIIQDYNIIRETCIGSKYEYTPGHIIYIANDNIMYASVRVWGGGRETFPKLFGMQKSHTETIK